jgi:Bacterial protein of unknown function (DUF937)
MIDQLINLVKENAGDVINNNPEIPADKKDQVAEVAGNSIATGFQDILAKGGVKDVMKLFSGGSADVQSSPVTSHISSSLVENLTSKLGLSGSQAGGIAGSLIPSVLGSLVTKTNDPNDSSFNLQDLFNQFSGGKTSGFNVGSLLSKFKGGLDKDGDGDVDLDDLKSLFGGTGGMMDKVKGMFK